jgi:hypothetical protein
MGIERQISLDFRSEQYCDFVIDQEQRDFTDIAEIENEWTAMSFVKRGIRTIHQSDLDVPSFRRAEYKVSSSASGRVINTVSIHEPIVNPCVLLINAILFLKDGMDPSSVEEIETAFDQVDIMDVDMTEAEFLRQGINPDDYHIALSFLLTRKSDPRLNDERSKAFVQQTLGLGFSVSFQGETVTCTASDAVQDERHVIDGDPDDPARPILEHETQEMQRDDCRNLGLTEETIGTVFIFPEFRMDWVLKKIRVGRCRVVKTHVPVLRVRHNRQVLVAYVVSEDSIRRAFDRAIRDCVIKAALETGILIAVTKGAALATVVTVFVTSCTDCIERKLSDDVRCLKPNLKLVTQRGDWVVV